MFIGWELLSPFGRADADRRAYIAAVERRGSQTPADRWFQDNTREPIRDETLRDGLVQMGAVVTRAGVATMNSLRLSVSRSKPTGCCRTLSLSTWVRPSHLLSLLRRSRRLVR